MAVRARRRSEPSSGWGGWPSAACAMLAPGARPRPRLSGELVAAVSVASFLAYVAFAEVVRGRAIAAGRVRIARDRLATALPYAIPIPYVVAALRPGPELPFPDGVRWAGLALVVAGVALAAWAAATLGPHFDLEVELHEGHEVVERGPYAIVRHPVYAGLIVHFVGICLATGNVLFILGTFGIGVPALAYRAAAEERLIRTALGPAYERYARRVPMLVPRLRRSA